jgi:hypothetical protein
VLPVLPTSPSSGSWHIGLRLTFVALALAVSLAILAFDVHPLKPAARVILPVVVLLVGLEVVLIGSYQLIAGTAMPTTRWTSLLFGVRPTAAQPSMRRERLWGGLFLLVGLLMLLTAAFIWLSLP